MPPTSETVKQGEDIVRQLQGGGGGNGAPAGASSGSSDRSAGEDIVKRLQQPTAAPKPGDIDPLTELPYTSVGTSTTPVGRATGRTIVEGAEPGFSTQADINLATDPEQRRRIAAKILYPSLDPGEAQARVFYGDDGRLAAINPLGQPYYIDPPSFSITSPSTWMPFTRAGAAAPAFFPAGGAVVGGFGGIPGAMAGAAAGDVARQEAANALDPGGSWRINPVQTGAEVIGAGAGEFGGRVLLAPFTRNPLAADVTGMTAADLRTAQQRAAQAQAQAQAQGITLTPGQASGLPGVLSTEDVFHSGSLGPARQAAAAAFYNAQSDAIRARQGQIFSGLATTTDKTEAAQQFAQGVEAAAAETRRQGNVAAKPYYDASQAQGPVPPGLAALDLQKITSTPAGQAAMDAARKDYHNFYGVPAPDTPDFNLWNLTKRKLDDAYDVAQRAGERTQAAAIDGLRKDLLTKLDAAYPQYSQARATTAPSQQLAARLESVTGAGGAPSVGDERAWEIVRPVFETKNARSIAEARNAFIAAGREDDWNNGVGAYLQSKFDAASKSQGGFNPSMFLRSTWRDPETKAVIQAAMNPAQFRGFQTFMETLEDVAKAKGMNSLTAPRQAGAQAITNIAMPLRAKGVQALGNLTSPWRLPDIVARAADRTVQNMTQARIDKIGARLFSPDGLKFLNRMAIVKPGTQEAVLAASRFLGEQGGAYMGEPGPPPPTADNPLMYAVP